MKVKEPACLGKPREQTFRFVVGAFSQIFEQMLEKIRGFKKKWVAEGFCASIVEGKVDWKKERDC